ncbi:MAG: CaiB/BaiF CoA transferase family protein, partial [Microthrixaceae bacterium]
MNAPSQAPLAGLRVIEVSLLGPGAVGTHLADLGAEVIKVEPPKGDYIRPMTWPIIEGSSLLHWHIHRGKRSITLDLKTDEGKEIFCDLVKDADAVIEAMRPGALAKRGLGFEDLREINPKIVFCTISGYGMTGPYAELPSHGIAYDTWAGLVKPDQDENGFPCIPEHPSTGIHAGPLFGAFGLLAGVLRARETGEGSFFEIAQSDSSAYMDWYRSETWKAYERPEDEVTGNASDNYERRAPGTAGMRDGVRYQIYESSDGHVLFMASEQEFWKNFCDGVGRMDLFDRWPGSKFADHAKGNLEMRRELVEIFKTKTTAEWVIWSGEHNTTIAPVNTPQTLADDPQFKDRLDFMGYETHG